MYRVNRRDILSATAMCLVPAVAKAVKPGLELCLACDGSGSMYQESNNYLIQRSGHVKALEHPFIVSILLRLEVVVTVVLWSEQVVELVSRQIKSEADLVLVRDILRTKVPSRVTTGNNTHHDVMLSHFVKKKLIAQRRIVDLSTDEVPTNNRIASCSAMCKLLFSSGTTVNALCINRNGDLTEVAEQSLITPDGFVKSIINMDYYELALQEKISRELSV